MWKPLTVMGSLIAILVMGCAPAALPPATPAPTVLTPSIAATSTMAPVSVETEAWNKVVDAAKKEGRITVYTYDMASDTGIAVGNAFKDKFGITVDFISGTSLVFLERIKTEYRVGQHAADLMDGSIRGTKLVMDEGFSASASELPVFKERDVWIVPVNSWDSKWRNLSTFLDYSTTHINTRLVKPADEPKSWYDLLDPKWKGQIIVSDPRTSTAMDMYYVLLAHQGVLEKDFFHRLATQDLVFVGRGARGPADALARGEGKIVAMTSTGSSNVVALEGAPIKAVSLKEGSLGTSHGITMIDKAPHPNAARVFLNWLYSAEGMTVFARARGGSSVRKDVQDFTPEAIRIKPTKVIMESAEAADLASANYKEGVATKILKAPKP